MIDRQFRESDHVTILSGYSSGSFLNKVLNDSPLLKMDLYLGMTQEGISKSSHEIFKKITAKNPNINVYYQVLGRPNHMKIYSLFRNGIQFKAYVGSANFTENGFEYNKEILIESDMSFDDIFDEQKQNSLICTDANIDKCVNIYDTAIEDVNIDHEISGNTQLSGHSKKTYHRRQDRLISLRNKINHKYFNEFELEVINYNDKNWATTGINSGFHGQEPHLPIGTKLFMERVFPNDTEFTIETVEGRLYKVSSSQENRNSLFFVDMNIYDYFKKRIGLQGRRPISRHDLDEANCSLIRFTRMDEYKYFAEFY